MSKSRKQAKHLIETNFMGVGDKVKHMRKPVKRKPKQNNK